MDQVVHKHGRGNPSNASATLAARPGLRSHTYRAQAKWRPLLLAHHELNKRLRGQITRILDINVVVVLRIGFFTLGLGGLLRELVKEGTVGCWQLAQSCQDLGACDARVAEVDLQM